MIPAQRQLLFDKLMEYAPVAPEDRKEIEEIVTEDLDAIEPLIDDMLNDAFKAGKRFADRKTEDDIVKVQEQILIV